jgi:hypothetical protein
MRKEERRAYAPEGGLVTAWIVVFIGYIVAAIASLTSGE